MLEPAQPSLNPGDLNHEELFPIREVSRLTGINPVTLRAWERRYGLIQPTRTESGHRLYSHADIEEVRTILGWIERGVAVSKVGKVLARSQSLKPQSEPAPIQASVGDYRQWQLQLRQAVRAFDSQRLEQVYGQVFSSYPLVVAFQDIILPVWQELRSTKEAFGHFSEWLFLDGFLRGRVLQRLQLSAQQQEVRVVLAAIPGHCRELELLVTALLLGSSEISVTVLGLGQPVEELGLVCERMMPHALVLFSNHPPAQDLPKRLARLALTVECPVLLAGEAADLAQDSLIGSQVACLGSEGRLMRRRLQQYLAGHLDS
ncbi:MerR family transcriptional regulator [Pseudomonas sp. H9]|uniref:MerR family transcriptional regulator n=1 Tax=Pseudomonas sp. H9 TaxID=483968 RepID=UPI00105820DD|nr:MerR family transcriptional regulator [Pseudomonas sp. H9]TDF79027.1 MerR family transcriptional regulator [Pseudomonas sp. H9]